MANTRLIHNLALFACVLTIAVIALGAFTRLIDAGLGCPDWPGCYGHLTVEVHDPETPLAAKKAWAEMIHRYIAATLSFTIVSLLALIFWQAKRYRIKQNIWPAIAIILLLTYQVLLGRWTVTLKLLPIVVTQHLLGALFILSLLTIIYLNSAPDPVSMPVKAKKYLPWLILGLFFIIVQIFLGAWTSTHYAGLSCPDVPFCSKERILPTILWRDAFQFFTPIGINYEGGVLPLIVKQSIQMIHRFGALWVSFYFLILSLILLHQYSHIKVLGRTVYILIALIFLQICLGMMNVVTELAVVNSMAHTITAALILITVVKLCWLIGKNNDKP